MADNETGPNQGRETRITDMRIIAWSLVVLTFGILWVAFQLTLIAADLSP